MWNFYKNITQFQRKFTKIFRNICLKCFKNFLEFPTNSAISYKVSLVKQPKIFLHQHFRKILQKYPFIFPVSSKLSIGDRKIFHKTYLKDRIYKLSDQIITQAVPEKRDQIYEIWKKFQNLYYSYGWQLVSRKHINGTLKFCTSMGRF